MEKSNSDNPMGIKRNSQKNTCSWQKRFKAKICKKKERKKYGFKYGRALLEKQRDRHTKCSLGGDHNTDYRWVHAKSDQAMILLPFFQQHGISVSN